MATAQAFEEKLQRVRTEAVLEACFASLSLAEAQALAEALQGNPLLQSLDLQSSSLGPLKWGGGLAQVEALAAGLRGSSVTTSGLRSAGLGDEGVQAVAAVLRESVIQSLDLRFNKIGAVGADALAEGLKSSSVTALDLSHNEVGDEGLKALAAALRETSLQSLDLHFCGISTAGACSLAASLKDSSLISLQLWGNDIGVEGGEALLEGLPDSPVLELNVQGCQISEETCSEIEAILQANKGRCFVLQMEVQKSENEVQMKFLTFAGTEAAVLSWSLDSPVQDLPEAVLASMRSSGFQLPFKGLRSGNLRFVQSHGAMLDVGPTAASLAQQLGIDVEPPGASSSEPPEASSAAS